MKRCIQHVGLAVLLLALGSPAAFAQGATSTIIGTVEDVSGGSVPGATILAVHDATTVKYTTVSGANGGFTIPAVAVGTYTLTVSLQGFKSAVLKGVAVSAAQPANVKARLEIGGLTEMVTVESASAMIQTQTSVAATTINTNQINKLPVGSRNTLDFVQFLPGVQTQGSVRDSTVAGLPQSTINITVDGVNVQDNYLKSTDGFFARMSPRLDAVEEVTLTTAAQGAEASGQGATQIKFTTRSGTNAFQVSLYHFYRSDKLNSNTYSNEVRGLPKGPLALYQGGGRVGGPIIIPGVYNGSGKAFFFVNYEHEFQPGTTTTQSNLLQLHAQQGFFRYNGGPAGGVNVLALAAANGFQSTVDPVIAKLLSDIRSSTASGAVGVFSAITGDLNVERYTFQQATESNNKFPTVRGDYNLTEKHRFTISHNRNYILSTPDTTNTVTRTFPNFPNFGEQASYRYQLTGALRSTLGANLVNEVRLGASGGPTQFSPRINPGDFTGTLANQMGYSLNINGALGITNGTRSTSRSSREPTTRVVEDTLTWMKGGHSISTGFSFTKLGIWLDAGNEATTVNFDVLTNDPTRAIFTSANFLGSSGTDRDNARALYSMLVGSVGSISGTARRTPDGDYVYNGRSFQQGVLRQFDTFFQDSWRVRPNLSVNLGVRYALQPAFYPLNSSYSGATVNEIWGVSGLVPGCEFRDPVGTGCNIFKQGTMTGVRPFYSPLDGGTKIYETDMDNVAPSLGVNYTPDLGRFAGLRTIFGAQSESSFSAGWVRAFNRHGLEDFTGDLDNNPGLNLTANRNTANGNLGALPLLVRSGYLGGPPRCSDSNNSPGCMIDRPSYPFYNSNDTGSITMFDPHLQVPYSDTYTAAWQRQLSRHFAVEARYVGTRSRQLWDSMDYNENNIHENGFVNEFRVARDNLKAHINAGFGVSGGSTCSFAYRGPGTGTNPLPTYLAYFSGLPSARAGETGVYTSTNWTSSTFVNDLGQFTSNVFNAASDLQDDATRRANALTAGLPANFFVANPNMLDGANVITNADFTRYNSLQLQVRKRLANGFSFDVNYVYGKGYGSNFDSFRVGRVLERETSDVTHAFKGNWIFQVPVGRGQRFGTDMNPWLNGLVGDWMFSGTFRIQSGDLLDLGNIRPIGMTTDEVRNLFKNRMVAPDIVYSWPQDIIDETIKAFSTSATSPTGYGALGAPSGRYFAPASNPNCFETISTDHGDCGVRSLIITGPMRFQMDFSFRKNIPLGGKRIFELSVDVFNPFNFVQWGGDVGLSTTLANWQPGLPGSSRRMQIGTRFTF